MNWDVNGPAHYDWPKQIEDRAEKASQAARVAALAKNGDVIGVGTGSSSYMGVLALAERIRREGLSVTVLPAAREIQLACAANGVPYTNLISCRPDWSFDGADEIDEAGDAIKGRGGGLFTEKLIIAASPRRYILASAGKFHRVLGSKPVPVEIFPEAVQLVREALKALGAVSVEYRAASGKDGPAVTEHGNILCDCKFERILPGLEKEIKSIPGVIESGLFQGYGFQFIR